MTEIEMILPVIKHTFISIFKRPGFHFMRTAFKKIIKIYAHLLSSIKLVEIFLLSRMETEKPIIKKNNDKRRVFEISFSMLSNGKNNTVNAEQAMSDNKAFLAAKNDPSCIPGRKKRGIVIDPKINRKYL